MWLTQDEWTEEYVPTSFDKVLATQEVNKQKVDLILWDTSGSPAYDSVRSLSYPDADVFLLCYKITDPISLRNVKSKWVPEIRRHARQCVPIILCGCQSDMRTDPRTIDQLSKVGRGPVSQDQALGVCCDIGAVNFIETSSKSYEATKEVQEAFELCALAAIKSGKCELQRSPSSASSSTTNTSHKQALNNSFGSQSDLSLPKKSGGGSASSSLKKKLANISFSGSENEPVINSVPPILEDDVFPCLSTSQARSPRLQNEDKRRIRSKSQHRVSIAPTRNELAFLDESPLFTSTTHRAVNGSNSPGDCNPGSQSPVGSAHVRANGLSRRTSFRSQTQRQGSIPVASPKSPLGGSVSSSSCYDLKSPAIADQTRAGVGQVHLEMKPAHGPKVLGFESLKSHASTGSQGSTGSKTSTGSSYGSTSNGNNLLRPMAMIKDPTVPDTEDPELLRNLHYVSPKAGVYRPVNPNMNGIGLLSGSAGSAGHNSSGIGTSKGKKNCSVM
eukprot:TCALIF_08399-PA protein Name:"Similar to RHO1 GTP-binding protein RHO1 (Ashbya gossypii (strain ATCC 10895 / CBS 109.51 / FGSC 9923 / NRRL Y-1056))" AED:0.04 eAED:0.04 QI:0/0.66/0.5/1/0.33/0.5/4/504/500